MPNIREIVDAQKDGLFIVLTASQVKAFDDADQCEEHAATLAGEQFAVVRLLWTGGRAPDPAQALDRETMERKRLETDANVRRAHRKALEQASASEPIMISVKVDDKPPEPIMVSVLLGPPKKTRLPSPLLVERNRRSGNEEKRGKRTDRSNGNDSPDAHAAHQKPGI